MKATILCFLIFLISFLQAQTNEQNKLEKYFEGYKQATFVMLDLNKDKYIRYNNEQASERFSPCSTFKILNSLIGLETGVIPDTDFVIKWDGVKRPLEVWNHDHTLKSAFAFSVVPYYQELARRVGRDTMINYIKKVHYGNEDVSGPIDKFWLMNSLKISADEQVNFLYKLVKNDLPFSQRSIDLVKDIMVYMKTDNGILRGKTGSGVEGDGENFLGWYVGYLTTKDNVYIFASNIQSERQSTNGMKVREIVISILKDMKLL